MGWVGDAQYRYKIPRSMEDQQEAEILDFIRHYPITEDVATAQRGKKRSVPVEDPAFQWPMQGGAKLGLKTNESLFDIPGIRGRELPREDGYPNTFYDKQEQVKRPYGRAYLDDMEERLRILAADPNYAFMRAIAGKLRKPVQEMFDEEDLDRVQRERENERQIQALENKRTRVSMDEKYRAIRNLEDLVGRLRVTNGAIMAMRPDEPLRIMSETLIDENQRTGQTPRETSYANLQRRQEEYRLITQQAIEPADRLDQIRALEHDEDTLITALSRLKEYNQQYLAFIWFVLFRDFFDNNSSLLVRESIDSQVEYATRQLAAYPIPAATMVVDDTTYGVLVEISKRDLGLFRALVPEDYGGDGIDWRRHFRHTDTIDLHAFSLLGLSLGEQREMINSIPTLRGSEYSREALDDFVAFIFSSGGNNPPTLREKRRLAWWKTPLQLIDSYPREVRLDSDAHSEVSLSTARNILRAHLLWVYFDETPLERFILRFWQADSALREGRTAFVHATKDLARRTTTLLDALKSQYDLIVFYYLQQLVDYFLERARNFLVEPLPSLGDSLAEANARYRESRAYEDPKALVADRNLLAYITQGVRAFQSQLERSIDEPVQDLSMNPAVIETVPEDNPVLVLHILFKYTRQYLDKYGDFLNAEILATVRAIDKARHKIASLAGDERVDHGDAEVGRASAREYVQRRAFTTQTINSGFVQIRAEIERLIDDAYHLSQEYCPNLRGMPLPGYHGKSAQASGLMDAFTGLMRVLYAKSELILPERYNSQAHHQLVPLEQQNAMARLRQFRYVWLGGDEYEVSRGPTASSAFQARRAHFLPLTL